MKTPIHGQANFLSEHIPSNPQSQAFLRQTPGSFPAAQSFNIPTSYSVKLGLVSTTFGSQASTRGRTRKSPSGPVTPRVMPPSFGLTRRPWLASAENLCPKATCLPQNPGTSPHKRSANSCVLRVRSPNTRGVQVKEGILIIYVQLHRRA